jgi:hypothetical protein
VRRRGDRHDSPSVAHPLDGPPVLSRTLARARARAAHPAHPSRRKGRPLRRYSQRAWSHAASKAISLAISLSCKLFRCRDSNSDSGIQRAASSDPNEREGVKDTTACAPACTSKHGVTPECADGVQRTDGLDPIEGALADALKGATAAGEWQVVAQLAAELQARRESRQAPEVVSLAKARAKRNGAAS